MFRKSLLLLIVIIVLAFSLLLGGVVEQGHPCRLQYAEEDAAAAAGDQTRLALAEHSAAVCWSNIRAKLNR